MKGPTVPLLQAVAHAVQRSELWPLKYETSLTSLKGKAASDLRARNFRVQRLGECDAYSRKLRSRQDRLALVLQQSYWTPADAGCTKIWTTGSTVPGSDFSLIVLSGLWMNYWVGHVDVARGCALPSWHANGCLFFTASWYFEHTCVLQSQFQSAFGSL